MHSRPTVIAISKAAKQSARLPAVPARRRPVPRLCEEASPTLPSLRIGIIRIKQKEMTCRIYNPVRGCISIETRTTLPHNPVRGCTSQPAPSGEFLERIFFLNISDFLHSSCRICNSAGMYISICNAQFRHTGYNKKYLLFFALQMLILSAAELQIRQDGASI
jgi:hypothetical protein